MGHETPRESIRRPLGALGVLSVLAALRVLALAFAEDPGDSARRPGPRPTPLRRPDPSESAIC